MKKLTSFLHHVARLIEAVDKEVSEYWRNFFADREEGGRKR